MTIIESARDTGAWGGVVLRRCATSPTVPGSIPGSVTGFFSEIFPSDSTMALVSIQQLPGGKGGRCVRLTTSPPS